MKQKLSITDHSRDIAGLKYVYPVISRRAGGLSIGINFNTNNACNWRCIYCQVPDLVRGAAPVINIQLLQQELKFFLQLVLEGEFYDQFNVPEQQRVIKDIAISGNGEPTSLKNFDQAVSVIGQIATEMQVLPASQFVLITNGSLIHQSSVQKGLKILNLFQGQVWFKLDSATEQGRKRINECKQSDKNVWEHLKKSASCCETRLQTCLMGYLDESEAEQEQKAYLELLNKIKQNQLEINKVMLYTLARPSLQPEAAKLSKMDADGMNQFASKITKLGFEVAVSL